MESTAPAVLPAIPAGASGASDATASPGPDAVSAPVAESTPARSPRRGGRGGASPVKGRKPGAPAKDAAAPAARARKAVHPALERLFALYPGMFGARFLPLKLGVFQDILARHPDVFQRDELKVALGLHARSTRYLEAVASGLARHDLDGQPLEPVAPEHVHHAVVEVYRRRQARSGEDLRPQVVARLVAAIEASGLSPDAYAERIGTGREPDAAALLDEALSAVRAQRARREALLRAYEASGATVEDFAGMYGLAPADAAASLQRARQERDPPAAAPAPLREGDSA